MDTEGSFIESINGSIDRSRWPVNRLPRAHKLAEAAAVLKSSGAPCALWGFDCEAFYRKMGRQRAQLWRNAIATHSKICCIFMHSRPPMFAFSTAAFFVLAVCAFRCIL